MRIIIIFLLSASFALAQDFRLDNWRAYNSYFLSNDFALDSEKNLWIASDGGIYNYNLASGEVNILSNIDDLIDVKYNSIVFSEKHNLVIAGSSNGIIEIIYPDGNVSHVTDIFSSSFTNKSINSLMLKGDSLLVAGDFGFAVFDLVNLVFIENIRRFGDFTSGEISSSYFDGERIWITVNQGVASVSINGLIVDPSRWDTYEINTPADENFLEIVKFEGDIFLASSKKLYKLVDDKFEVEFTSQYGMHNTAIVNGELIIADRFDLLRYPSFEVIEIDHFVEPLNGVGNFDVDGENITIISYQNIGTRVISDSGIDSFINPNSPYTNAFSFIKVDSDGNLLATLARESFAIFDGNQWQNFNRRLYDDIKTDNFQFINRDLQGRYIVSSFGGGLLRVDLSDDTAKIETFNETNSPFIGQGGPSFIVIGESVVDNEGNVWVTNFGELNTVGPVVHALKPNGEFTSFSNRSTPGIRAFRNIAIDRSGTKWVAGHPILNARGIYYFNDRGTLSDDSDDYFGFLSTSTNANLPSNSVYSIKTDKNGVVYIGTDRGLAAIINPSAVAFDSDLLIRNIALLGIEQINSITIDAINQKWIATNNGVFVLNQDATDVISVINSDNSPLPTNEIISIENDPRNGDIYFGTQQGLFVARSLSVEPVKAFDIQVYPQPFDPTRDLECVIDGLAPGAEIRIMTTNGSLIRKISNESRTLIWDGRDEQGNLVGNGVYLIVAASSLGSSTGVAKIAVVIK